MDTPNLIQFIVITDEIVVIVHSFSNNKVFYVRVAVPHWLVFHMHAFSVNLILLPIIEGALNRIDIFSSLVISIAC